MPRGQPDFGMYAAETYLAGMSDMAELAVRLGSIVIFDRRGKVVDLDDFEDALFKWVTVNVGASHSLFSSASAKSGTQSIIQHVGGVGDTPTYMERGFTLLPSKRLGVEIAYAKPSTTAYLLIRLYRAITTSHAWGQIKLDFNAKKVYYQDSAGNYQEITDITTPSNFPFVYYPIKFVVDFDTGFYERLIFEGVEHDLSAYALYSVIIGSVPGVQTRITWTRIGGAGSDIYIDDYILTMEEP